MSAAPKRVRVKPLAGCIRKGLCRCGCMRTSADACTQWPAAVLDQLQQTLDRRDAASFSRDSPQGALMLELACLPGAERAGFTLCAMTETDGLCLYLLSRWGLSRTLPDLVAVAVFLRLVGASE